VNPIAETNQERLPGWRRLIFPYRQAVRWNEEQAVLTVLQETTQVELARRETQRRADELARSMQH